MECYLCGRKSARPVWIDNSTIGTVAVCGICDERGTYCSSCDVPLRSEDEKVDYGDFVRCEMCEESARWAYQESRVF